LQEGGSDAVSTSSTRVQQLQHIINSNIKSVPQAACTGDKALLTDSQRDSLAIFRRFNISQPQLRGQVILAKVLRSTPKYLLVDPGYYGMNVVPRQVRTVTQHDISGTPSPQTARAAVEYPALADCSNLRSLFGVAACRRLFLARTSTGGKNFRRLLRWLDQHETLPTSLPVQRIALYPFPVLAGPGLSRTLQ
jgi:hypothetical protein